jgi:hypothetical protein
MTITVNLVQKLEQRVRRDDLDNLAYVIHAIRVLFFFATASSAP